SGVYEPGPAASSHQGLCHRDIVPAQLGRTDLLETVAQPRKAERTVEAEGIERGLHRQAALLAGLRELPDIRHQQAADAAPDALGIAIERMHIDGVEIGDEDGEGDRPLALAADPDLDAGLADPAAAGLALLGPPGPGLDHRS